MQQDRLSLELSAPNSVEALVQYRANVGRQWIAADDEIGVVGRCCEDAADRSEAGPSTAVCFQAREIGRRSIPTAPGRHSKHGSRDVREFAARQSRELPCRERGVITQNVLGGRPMRPGRILGLVREGCRDSQDRQQQHNRHSGRPATAHAAIVGPGSPLLGHPIVSTMSGNGEVHEFLTQVLRIDHLTRRRAFYDGHLS